MKRRADFPRPAGRLTTLKAELLECGHMRKSLSLLLLFCAVSAAPARAQAAPCFDTPAPCASADAAPAAPQPRAEAVAPAALRPVVISVVGISFSELNIGKLELSYFRKIIEHFRPGDKQALAALSDREARLRADYAEAAQAKPAVGHKDDYLDARLAQALPADQYEIVPVRWSRDPDDSDEALALLEREIKRIFIKAKGRPVYLVAHSWGSVLSHTALNRLAASDPQVRVDKFITLGSPLVPGHWWLDIFMDAQISNSQLQSYVRKPANTGTWLNVWAERDILSNRIEAADRNTLEDGWTSPLERRILRLMDQDHHFIVNGLKDLFNLKNFLAWHFAYIFDYKVYLKTLREDHARVIFDPVVASELQGAGRER